MKIADRSTWGLIAFRLYQGHTLGAGNKVGFGSGGEMVLGQDVILHPTERVVLIWSVKMPDGRGFELCLVLVVIKSPLRACIVYMQRATRRDVPNFFLNQGRGERGFWPRKRLFSFYVCGQDSCRGAELFRVVCDKRYQADRTDAAVTVEALTRCRLCAHACPSLSAGPSSGNANSPNSIAADRVCSAAAAAMERLRRQARHCQKTGELAPHR